MEWEKTELLAGFSRKKARPSGAPLDLFDTSNSWHVDAHPNPRPSNPEAKPNPRSKQGAPCSAT